MQVPWDNLSPQQLETHPLWTYVDPTDGEYVRPCSGEVLDGGQKLGDLLLSAWFTLRNGTKFIGFVHGVAGEFEFSERCFGDLSPYLVLSDSFALNLFAFPPTTTRQYQEVQVAHRAEQLGYSVMDMYPIRFRVIRPIPGAVSEGVIPGLMFYRVVRPQRFLRRAKTVLVAEVPG